MSGKGQEAFRISGSGWETIPDLLKWSGGLPGCPRDVGRLSRIPGVVGRPSRMPGSGRETLPNVWEWYGGPPISPGAARRPALMSGSGWEALSDAWESLPDIRE